MLVRAFLALAFASVMAVGASAAEFATFTAEAFDGARKSGKSILVHVHAPWCPTCRAQMTTLDKLAPSADFKDVVALRIDFDSQKDALKAIGATSQSVIVVYKGETEVGRSVGATDPKIVEDVARKAL